MGFDSEISMVDAFVEMLDTGETYYGNVLVEREWDYKSGYVDILALNDSNQLVAFEAKLSDWKRAFNQAYRNTAYANMVYVLLPECTVHRALTAQDEFEHHGIGLCSFDGSSAKIYIEAKEQDAILVWLRKKAHEYFNGFIHEQGSIAGQCRASNMC